MSANMNTNKNNGVSAGNGSNAVTNAVNGQTSNGQASVVIGSVESKSDAESKTIVETKTSLDTVESGQALQIDFAIKFILKNILKDYKVDKIPRENLILVINLMLQGEKFPEKMKEAFGLLNKMQAEFKAGKPDAGKPGAEKIDANEFCKKNYRNIVMYLLGMFYHYGFSGMQQHSMAVEIYEALVKDQFAPASFSLGLCLEMGLGCKQNLARAFGTYSNACEWAEKQAREMNSASYLIGVFQYQFGLCYEYRKEYDGTDRNGHSLATKYYELASGQKNNGLGFPCKKSYPRALRALGLLHVIDKCEVILSPNECEVILSPNKSDYIQGIKFLVQANKAYECFEGDHSLEVDLKELKEHQELQCLQFSQTSELTRSAEASQASEAQNNLIYDLSNADQEILKQEEFDLWDVREINEAQVSLAERLLKAKVELDPLDVNLCLGKFHSKVGGEKWRMDRLDPILGFFELDRCKQFANAGQSPCHALIELGKPIGRAGFVSAGVVDEMENECIKAIENCTGTTITKPGLRLSSSNMRGLKNMCWIV